MRGKKCRGWTLIELWIVLVILGVFASLASLPGAELSQRLLALRMRHQLMNDLHTARVLAIERQTPLVVQRLTECPWFSDQLQDWGCGWQIRQITSPHSTQASVLRQTEIDRPLHVWAYPAAPVQVNSQGDLVGVGLRWQFKPFAQDRLSWLICVNAASRMRTLNGENCS